MLLSIIWVFLSGPLFQISIDVVLRTAVTSAILKTPLWLTQQFVRSCESCSPDIIFLGFAYTPSSSLSLFLSFEREFGIFSFLLPLLVCCHLLRSQVVNPWAIGIVILHMLLIFILLGVSISD